MVRLPCLLKPSSRPDFDISHLVATGHSKLLHKNFGFNEARFKAWEIVSRKLSGNEELVRRNAPSKGEASKYFSESSPPKRKKAARAVIESSDDDKEPIKPAVRSPPVKKAKITPVVETNPADFFGDKNAFPSSRATSNVLQNLDVPEAHAPARPSTRVKTEIETDLIENGTANKAEPISNSKQAAPKSEPSTPVKKPAAPSKRKLPGTITGDDVPETTSGSGSAKRKLPPAVKEEATEDTPPAKKKFNAFEHKNRLAAGPVAPGSKEIPEGNENCFADMSFVFTGNLSSISRDEATNLVKRYAGRVVGTPSGKTSYVVVGDDPGESKLKKATTLNLKTIDEDGFLDLIRTLPGKGEPSAAKGKGKGKAAVAAAKAVAQIAQPAKSANGTVANAELWTTKYMPRSYNDIIGNKTLVQQLATWLRRWESYRAKGFKRQGGDEYSDKRAALLSGPPGIGKTTSAHLVAQLEGFDVLEFNASDVRSKKALGVGFGDSIGSHAVTEYFGTSVSSTANGRSLAAGGSGRRQVVVMDEVDGMSGGDRGGTAELIQMIKKSKVPIICICNDRQSPKVKSLANYCADFRFRRPTAVTVEARMRAIAAAEGLELKANVVEQLVISTQADIRQILNLLSTYRLRDRVMSFDQSQRLSRAAEKDGTISSFDATAQLFGYNYMKMSLADKMQLYFNDYSIMSLFVQEQYVRMKPAIAEQIGGPRGPKFVEYETLTCMANAADSISLGDLVDNSLRGQQNWVLMPIHAVMSTVRPCFFTHGKSGGMMTFPSWLGRNSTQMKNTRLLREIQSHMQTHVSGNKREVRLNYLPALTSALVAPLVERGADAIDEVIEFMDDYYLSREDRDSVFSLGLGKAKDRPEEKIPANVKTAFTKAYNKGSHPTAVLNVVVSKSHGKSSAAAPVPDFEDAIDADEAEEEDDVADDDDDDDIAGDRLVTQKARPSSAAKGKAAASSSKAKGKAKASSSGSSSKRK
ncbi:replication factor RFC1 C terminal domain-containing protein [Geranomyces variabilis]|nr:replication factor RFC1 C terminal domain-containing protein [Geranomyces variabilis]